METMREARARLYERSGIPADGGQSDAWVDFKLGPLPMPFPNTPARKRAVPLHDLHHVLTGYATDIIGEFEIGAWEIGAGCGRYAAAWALNLMGLTAGALVAPLRTFRAFRRGLRSDSLYTTVTSEREVLEHDVEAVRARLNLDRHRAPRLGDVLTYLGALVGGLLVTAVTAALLLTPVTPIAWLWGLRATRLSRATP